MKIAAAILAGGKATRLGGIAKGLLGDRHGTAILNGLIEELAAAGIADIVISANDPAPYRAYGKRILEDVHPDVGPLGGVEAVLAHLAGGCEAAVLLPCDLPNISAQEILMLMNAHRAMPGRIVFASTRDGEHPLCAVVPVGVLGEVSKAIAAGQYGVGRLWKTLGAVTVEIGDSSRLLNINTPDDLQQWQHSLQRPQRPGDA